MRKLLLVSLVIMLILQGCDINIMGGVSISSVDSKYQFENYEGYLAIKDEVAEDDDYYTYDVVIQYDETNLELYTVFENIEIIEESREDIEVRYFVVYDPVLKANEPEVLVTKQENFKVDVEWDAFNGKAHGMMEVKVPIGFDSDLRAESVSGDILLEAVRGKDLNLKTTSGDVDVLEAGFNSGRLDSTSGDITMKACDIQELNCETTSGDIELDGIKTDQMHLDSTSGDVAIQADVIRDTIIKVVSGDIKVTGRMLEGNLGIDTVSGSVRLIIDDLDARVEYDTTSGDFKTNKAMTMTSGNDEDVRGTIGEGKYRVNVDTTSGDFRIE